MTGTLLAPAGELLDTLATGDLRTLDVLAAAAADGRITALLLGARPRHHDPVALAIATTARIPGVALLVTSDDADGHPYNAARRLLTLDHLSGGRGGVVFAGDPTTPERTAERIGVIRALWNSWPRSTLIADRATGTYARADSIRAVDHAGPDYRVHGALNSPSSRQGEPVSLWHVSTRAELDAASGLVDLVLVTDPALAELGAVRPVAPVEGHGHGLVVHGSGTFAGSPVAVLHRAESLADVGRLPAGDPQAAAPSSTRTPPTVRALLGLSERRLDLSAKPLALGGPRA